ncbi:MAG: hypothetical protein IJL25_01165, partial [Clostridia bacterium]|nr:hypothetical protein [Clostridia bacterium]MBR5423264.1 hypothetical protein [Clostridia bacterium]
YIRLSGIMGFRAVMPAPTNIPNISAFLIREFLSFFFYHKHLDKLKFDRSARPLLPKTDLRLWIPGIAARRKAART